MDEKNEKKERIVIVGGGFAGLNLVKKLDKEKFDIILVDKNNFHSFPPLFYQIASSGLDPSNICFPFRREMRKERAKGARFQLGEVKEVDTAAKTITTQFQTIHYDKLIFAAGAKNNFFGNDQLEKYVYTLKSTAEAMRVRNEVLDRLERASLSDDDELQRKMLCFVVVGGGPTGVEMAGALGEMKRDIIPREYPTINPDNVNIILLEGADRLLSTMSVDSSIKAKKYLGKLMVEVRLNTKMDSYDQNIVRLDNGDEIFTSLLIWTAGITAQSFTYTGENLQTAPGGRFPVDNFNRVVGHDDIFAVGDIAYMPTERFPRGLPQLAQVAIQQASLLAKQINSGDFRKEFVYNDKGSMATVGRNLAVAELPHLKLGGFPAWLTWMFVHLISILGMRNKANVLLNWIWEYFTYNTSLRILLHSTRYPLRKRWGEN
ncbi:MAG: NAD(P)/FAD-dependent oxidoreductase [Muribaculaceae bacterium]|nr:NAD(P)/FAD-dependent oxidoreductase [Muribaculaceae bacterium]